MWKRVIAVALFLSSTRIAVTNAFAFAPSKRLNGNYGRNGHISDRTRTRVAFAFDPHFLSSLDVTQTHDSLLSSVAQVLADGDAATAVAKDDWFAGFVNVIEGGISACGTVLEGVTGQKSMGFSIVLFTLLIKAITYPLTYSQLESTAKMQAIQPRVKQIQEMYQSNPEVLQRELGMLYQSNNVNPLAGCLPAIVQIPIFVALYRALLKLATDNQLNEPFLWLPNLEGPVYGAQNSDWLFKNWEGLTPSLGWHDTLCFLSLPVILVISQSISQKFLQPPKTEPMDESQAASQAIIQYLPLMIGFFALNVPSGLAVYWIVNNLVSTTATVLIKQQVAEEMRENGFDVPPSLGGSSKPSEPSSSISGSSFEMSSAVVDVASEDSVETLAPPVQVLKEAEGFGAPVQGSMDDPFAPIAQASPSNKQKKKTGSKKSGSKKKRRR